MSKSQKWMTSQSTILPLKSNVAFSEGQTTQGAKAEFWADLLVRHHSLRAWTAREWVNLYAIHRQHISQADFGLMTIVRY